MGSTGPNVAIPTASYLRPLIHSCGGCMGDVRGERTQGYGLRFTPRAQVHMCTRPHTRETGRQTHGDGRTLIFPKVSSGVVVSKRIDSRMLSGRSCAMATWCGLC